MKICVNLHHNRHAFKKKTILDENPILKLGLNLYLLFLRGARKYVSIRAQTTFYKPNKAFRNQNADYLHFYTPGYSNIIHVLLHYQNRRSGAVGKSVRGVRRLGVQVPAATDVSRKNR